MLGMPHTVESAPASSQEYSGTQQVNVVPTIAADRQLPGNATGTVTENWMAGELRSGSRAYQVNDRTVVALHTATPLTGFFMLANRFSLAALGMTAALVLTGCNTVSEAWDSPRSVVPEFLQPYRADVHQGNLITSEMVLQLEKGMTQPQVQFLLGIPLLRDQFHPYRWDYIYYLLRGNDDRQLRKLTVWFNEDGRVDHWTSDPMPDEEQADQMILGTTDTFEPRAPQVDPGVAAQH